MFKHWKNYFSSNYSTQSSTYHFTLHKGQWLEILQEPSHLRVLSGTAWLIVGKRDVVLTPGQEQHVSSDRYPAVILGLGSVPVEVEVISTSQPRFAI